MSAERLLRELIAIPSVNPAFLPAGDPRAGEETIGRFLADAAAKRGLDVGFEEVAPRRLNVEIRLTPSRKPRRRVLLAPHLDTVGEPGLDRSLFRPVKKNDRLYGRGACDTKGSIAAMLSAMFELADGARPTACEIVFLGLIDEENQQAGSRLAARRRWKVDLGIVGEPTCLRVVTAHKGDIWLRLRTVGRSAHGARPELGQNAVHAMARVVDLLETTYAAELRQRRHPLLGSPTINVGRIEGGNQPNIVPDRCEIAVDRRTLPGETQRMVEREIERLARRYGCRVDMESLKNGACVALETDPERPLIRQLMAIAGQESPCGVDFFCDAAVLAAGGIPCVVFGPGDIAQAHTPDEWISVRSLNDGTRMLTRFLREITG